MSLNTPVAFSLKLMQLGLASVFSAGVATPVLVSAQTESVNPPDEKTQEASPAKTVAPEKKADAKKSDPTVKAAAPGINQESTQKVTITGSRQSDLDERRLSTAAKIIFGREELDRNGDSTLGEVLKRLPGVTIGGRPGRGGDIRMRGMGSGYTQILLNGERPPRGFSMDSLSPDQVERIEIIRGPVAEYSTQAIAGTINIVLREDYKQKDTEIKFSESLEQGRSAPNLSITYPAQIGSLSYALSASIFQNRQHDENLTTTLEKNPQGQPSLMQTQNDETNRRTRGIHLAPRMNYRFENGDTLMLQPFLMNSRSDSNTSSVLGQTLADPNHPAEYAMANTASTSENSFLRGFGTWQHKFEDNAKLNIKFGGGVGKINGSSLRTDYANNGAVLTAISDVNDTRDSSINTGGKYTQPWGDKHTLAAGWDLETSRREQVRTSVDSQGHPQFAESGDNIHASTRRIAVFVQDEFDINAQLSAYVGLRWEGIRTGSTSLSNAVNNISSVWSPVLHGVWRLPGASKDQVRVSLTNAYRAPGLNDLIALPSISPINSPTRPDRTGNPNLKPELSKGVDIAFEHYLSRAGIMSVNVFARDIDDLIRRRTLLVNTLTGPRWVSSPVNIGHATTKGVELEAKFQWQEFFPEGPAIDLRSNYSRFWSSVDDIPGPNNRLDQQPRQTANFGLDYRMARLPLTFGGNINWTPAYEIQTSETQINSTGIKRQLDLYGLWKINPVTQLRLSAGNVSANDYLNSSIVTTGGINHMESSVAKTYTTWSLRFEIKM
ncbi:TonB-dependent receptor [Undibacterium sp. Jales W-56]|uniref:TonB-dependent receptor plug domain-containing protein n=1 Tax=Undibacterium sp. Jales W-56 TaxID=2897325 RepID=UPI0021D3B8CB|nr:TonB-dependent receptor [Undibacterium sp. Jales W-56]MCU6433281.1 TonB-dependent receptor [Undibacterium sp. Jales W-56]